MAGSTKVWVNGSAPQCEDDDLNGFKNENNNLILHSGQALNTADNDQTSKAASVFAAGADFYTDSGSGTAYVLTAVGLKPAPPNYFDGMRIRFIPDTTNSGGSGATVKVGALAAVSLRALDGAVLDDGMIVVGVPVEGYYVSATGFFNLKLITTADMTVFRQWKFVSGLTQFGGSAPGDTWSLGNALEISKSSALWGTDNGTYLLENAYYNGGYKYQDTDFASRLELGAGNISLSVAPSGTEDTGITWLAVVTAHNDGGATFGSPAGGSQGPGTGNFENDIYIRGVKVQLGGNGCLVYLDSNTNVPDVTTTTLGFDQEDHDDESIHDNVTNNSRLTVPTGVTRVRLTGQVAWSNMTSNAAGASIYKNGVTTFVGYPRAYSYPVVGGGTGIVQVLASVILNVVAGDYFEIKVYQDTGGAETVIGNANGNQTFFSMELIK